MVKILITFGIFFSIFNLRINAQTIPSWRTVNWLGAGNHFDFSTITDSVNVMDYGAMADGITNDYQAVMDAIGSFNGQAGIVYFPSGTYLINSPINLPDSIILRGEGAVTTILKLNTAENQNGIQISGSISTTFFNVISGYYKNSQQITLSDSSIFQAGDYAELLQDGIQHMTSSWAMNCLGQIVRIDSVNSYEINLSEPLRMDYLSALNPRIRKVLPKHAIAIQCLKIESQNPTVSQTSNIFLNYARDCEIKGVESYKCNFSHIEINKSTAITVRNSHLHHGHSYGDGGRAYGVCIQATSGSCLTENNVFDSLRHAMLLQSGANGNVFTYNYSLNPYWTDVTLPANSAGDIVLHGNYPYANLFEGNIVQHIVIDDSHGKNGPFNTYFRNRAELYGIFMNSAPATDSLNFVGNEVTNTNFLMGLYIITGTGHFQHGNNIKGTITPAGTNTLNDTSYFYTVPPSFWLPHLNFPLIGLPLPISSQINPAKTRYISGIDIATCTDTTYITTIYEKPCTPCSFDISACYFNAMRLGLNVTIFARNLETIKAEIYSISGSLLAVAYIKPLIGTSDYFIPFRNSLSTGLFNAIFTQSGCTKTIKFINR